MCLPPARVLILGLTVLACNSTAGRVPPAATTEGGGSPLSPSRAQSPFDAPTGTVLASARVSIPLVKDGGFHYADVELNGTRFRFALETGAGFLAISSRAASQLGLPVDSVEVLAGARSAITRVDSLRMGGALFTGLVARVVPRWSVGSFDGIISIPLLHDVLATLDLAANELRLERGALPAPNDRDIIPITGSDRGGRIDIPITLGGVPVAAVLDTRAGFWLIVPDSLEPRLPLAAAPTFVTNAYGPSLGGFQLRGARLAGDLTIGHTTVHRPAVLLRDRPGVVIGVPLLEQVILTLDQRNRRVRVTPARGATTISMPPQAWEGPGQPASGAPRSGARSGQDPSATAPAAAGPPSGMWTIGFLVGGAPGGNLRVMRVLAGSSAEQAGVRAGDQVVELDGTLAAAMSPERTRAVATGGRPFNLVLLRDGQRLELTLTPFRVP